MSNRVTRVGVIAAGTLLALCACAAAPPVDGLAPGAAVAPAPTAHDFSWNDAGIWLAILAVAGLLTAGVLLLASGRRTGR